MQEILFRPRDSLGVSGVQKNRVKQPGDGGETRGISISSAGFWGTSGADLNCGPHRNRQSFQRPFRLTPARLSPKWEDTPVSLGFQLGDILSERRGRSYPLLVIYWADVALLGSPGLFPVSREQQRFQVTQPANTEQSRDFHWMCYAKRLCGWVRSNAQVNKTIANIGQIWKWW